MACCRDSLFFNARFTMSFAFYATAATHAVLQSRRLEGFNSQTVASRLIVAIRRDDIHAFVHR